jgi:hypothetical protein
MQKKPALSFHSLQRNKGRFFEMWGFKTASKLPINDLMAQRS